MRTNDIGGIDATDKITRREVRISLFDNAGADIYLRSSVVTGADIAYSCNKEHRRRYERERLPRQRHGRRSARRTEPRHDPSPTTPCAHVNGEGIVLQPAPSPQYNQVGGNDVRRSTGWGVCAPGALDLGGNVARNNGSEPQCVGVVCSPS